MNFWQFEGLDIKGRAIKHLWKHLTKTSLVFFHAQCAVFGLHQPQEAGDGARGKAGQEGRVQTLILPST